MGLFNRIKEPVRGAAQVVAASQMPRATSANCRMTLVVQAEGMVPYSVEHHDHMVSTDKWPVAGEVLPVTVDRRKPERLRVEWDEVPSAREASRARADALAARMAAGGDPEDQEIPPEAQEMVDRVREMFPGATVHVQDAQVHHVDPAQAADLTASLEGALGMDLDGDGRIGGPAGAAATGGGADRISQLERLQALRDSGALTESEFQAEKARILGASG